jgi:phenylpropionate dioxygenase-like ring-hydroxylating dioxygenase large terminal subunit
VDRRQEPAEARPAGDRVMSTPAAPGAARSPGATYQDLLDADSRPENVPVVLRWVSNEFLGSADIPRSRYVTREFHELEKEKVWKKTWQMACREEDIPDVGDTLVYDICELSILVVRSAPDTIRAYYNACLHRGRQLKEGGGNNTELRCPFHGYCWNLDGSLKQIPSEWDFPHVDASAWSLPTVRVGTWGGFVFVNLDPDADSLEAHLGELPEHFAKWPLEQRYKAVHVAKVFPANWKVVQEAFMEAFHVVATHPQLLAGIGDANSQYDWKGMFSRAITPNGTPSPHIRFAPTEQEMFDAMTDRRLDEDPIVQLGEHDTARSVAGAGGRMRLRGTLGERADELSDAELADSIYYTLFPNFHPWGAYNRITYRFRPYGDRHDMAIMECMFLDPYDLSKPKPPAVAIHWLGIDDDWTEAPELGMLARVFNQDSFNLPKVQIGLASLQKDVTLANYQETKIRHFHHLLDQFIGG